MLTLEEQLRRFHKHSLTLGWRSFLKYSSKNLVVFSPCPNNVSRPELRGNKQFVWWRIFHLQREDSIQALTWLLLLISSTSKMRKSKIETGRY